MKGKVKVKGKVGESGINSIIKNGKVSIDDLKANPSVFSGKSVDEIAQALTDAGYDVTVKASTRSRSGAQIIKINNPGGGKNISQVQAAVKNGGILDSTSKLLNNVIDEARKNKLINKNVATMLKRGKNMILEGVNNNIEDLMTAQIKSVEKIDKYTQNWTKYYQSKDFEGMQKEYKKMENELKNVIPLEQTIKSARQIENIHNLIKNRGQDFNISEYELELAKKLI